MTQVMPFNPRQIAERMLQSPPVDRGEWQSDTLPIKTYELHNVILQHSPTALVSHEAHFLGADQPWAEKHFQERISGIPMNPPPSAAEWPWHQAAKNKHTEGDEENGIYSHTYPERFWPKRAGMLGDQNWGIRYGYGDLADLIRLLRDRPFTRQAYLPIWFPEDTGAPTSQRVPCTLGYHLIRNGSNLDLNYFIRSCDMTRHLRNDMYFAVRLLQHVRAEVANDYDIPMMGTVTMFISNLHIFEADAWRWVK